MTYNYYSKYHNQKTGIHGSKGEAKRAEELRLLERAGEIKDLQFQVKFVLIPVQREPPTIGRNGGVNPGRVLERECAYYADFTYYDKNGNYVVEDYKGIVQRITS